MYAGFDRGRVIGQYRYRHFETPLFDARKYGTSDALVQVFDALDLQVEVAGVAGFVGGFDVQVLRLNRAESNRIRTCDCSGDRPRLRTG
jgi:hypothetical protein